MSPVVISEYARRRKHQSTPSQSTQAGHNNRIFIREEYEDEFHESYWAAIKALALGPGKLGMVVMFDSASDFRDEGDAPGRIDKRSGRLSTHTTKKDPFYFYQANWTNTPVLYITSRTFWTPASHRDQRCERDLFQILDSVTLSINGKTIGTKTPNSIKVADWTSRTLKTGAKMSSPSPA